MNCLHENFEANAAVNRISDVEGAPVNSFLVELIVKCIDCGMPFCFRGMPVGLSHMGPTMSLDARTACLPIHPEDDPTTGIGSPGFLMGIHWPGDDAGPAFPGVDTSDPDDHGVV